MITAIIPAKGSSEGVPNKNLKDLGSKPLVQYTIEAALNSRYINDVVLTSDSDVIGAQFEWLSSESDKHSVSINRLGELAQAHVQVDEVVLFTLRELQLMGYAPKTVVVLQPTSPFRTAEHIDQAIELYNLWRPFSLLSKRPTVIGVKDSGYAYRVEGDELYPLSHEPAKRLGRQDSDYSDVCIENGSLYIVDAKRLSRERTFRAGPPFTPFYMDDVASFEIDTPLQWDLAEVIVKHVYNS